MSFTEKFKKANTKIAKSSVAVYLRNIKRLSKLAKNKTDFPETGKWLSKKGLFAAVHKLPLTAKKALSAAAVKASKVYGQKVAVWEKLMRQSSFDYEKQRDGRKKTTREKQLWSDYGKVYKGGAQLWAKLPEADTWKFKDLQRAQKAYLLLLYGTSTPRLLESLRRPGKKGPNQLLKTKGGFRIVLRDYKTAKSRGNSEFALHKKIVGPTRTYLEQLNRLVETDFVFFNARKQKLSKSSFSKLLTSATRLAGLKGVSAQLLRVFKASSPETQAIIEKARALEAEMGHSGKENVRYSKK